MRIEVIVLAGAALAVAPAVAEGQEPTRRRQAPIEIRGQVPTPQVVTVRPREVPAYSRQVLVPRFFDHDFWPDIQAAYQLVPQRQVDGHVTPDSLAPSAAPSAPAAGTVPAGNGAAAPASRTPAATTTPRAAPPGTARAPRSR